MGREDATRADGFDVPGRYGLPSFPLGAFTKKFEGQQAGVPFVQVEAIDFRESERPGHPDASDPQYHFLTDTIVSISAVEKMRQGAVPCGIFRQVRIQKQNRHVCTGNSCKLVAPRPQNDGAILDLYGRPLRQLREVLLDFPFGRRFMLPPRLVEILGQISFSMQQGDRDDAHSRIGAGAQRIAGQHPEAAGVGWHRGIHRDLHGKIGDTCVVAHAVGLGFPPRRIRPGRARF